MIRWSATMAVLVACSGDPNGANRDGLPGIVVELVEPGRLSTVLPEFATAFSPSGDSVYFNRTPADRSRLDLFVSMRVNGVWSEPSPLEATVGRAAIDPFVSLDGQRLYFSSDMRNEGESSSSFNLWYLERRTDGWSSPTRLPAPVASDSSDVYTSFTRDGELVFSSRREGVRRIYVTRESTDGWSTPAPISFGDMDGSNPMVSPDGDFLVFAATGPSGRPDLFVACEVDGVWANPRPLPAPINTDFTEFAPSIWGDQLYFSSERPGVAGPVPDSVRPPGDLYRTELGHVSNLCTPEDS